MNFIDIFGTSCSVLIAISLMQKNIKWLRILNSLGSLSFAIYGAMIGAMPVLILNIFIVIVNSWYLIQDRFQDDHFDYIEVKAQESEYLQRFLDFHLDDIQTFSPHVTLPIADKARSFLILRNAQPVALVVLQAMSQKRYEIVIDYAIPQYRDRKSAFFFFNYVIKRLHLNDNIEYVSKAGSQIHEKYLLAMGFQSDGQGLYIKEAK